MSVERGDSRTRRKLAAEPQVAGKKRERVFFTEETRDGVTVIVERASRG